MYFCSQPTPDAVPRLEHPVLELRDRVKGFVAPESCLSLAKRHWSGPLLCLANIISNIQGHGWKKQTRGCPQFMLQNEMKISEEIQVRMWSTLFLTAVQVSAATRNIFRCCLKPHFPGHISETPFWWLSVCLHEGTRSIPYRNNISLIARNTCEGSENQSLRLSCLPFNPARQPTWAL